MPKVQASNLVLVSPSTNFLLPTPAVEVECELGASVLTQTNSLINCDGIVRFTDTSQLFAEKQAEKAKALERAKSYRQTAPIRSGNTFKYGYCTWYVANRFPITWGGNAYQWATNARSQGYQVDRIPEAGAILQTSENSYGSRLGHVAYIEKVENGLIYLTEMNFSGWNKVTSRIIPTNYSLIVAVIHRR